MNARKLAVIIPVYNEGGRLADVLARLSSRLLDLGEECHLVVVDDGSAHPVSIGAGAAAPSVPVHLLRHGINLGQGAALQTGVEFARDVLHADVFVTMDADGQHCPDDLPALVAALADAEIAFGTRFATDGGAQVPTARRVLLKAARLFERCLTGLALSDAHNGYRAFTRTFAAAMSLCQNRMAHATEIKLIVARHGIPYCEVPVSITYSEETLAKGQRNSGSFFILRDLMRGYLFHG